MRILIAAPTLGISSEVWILRQIEGLVNLGHDVSVVCWQNSEYEPQNHTDRPVSVVPGGLARQGGFKRWRNRFKNIFGRNFVRGTAQQESFISNLIQDIEPDVVLCHFGYIAMRVLPVADQHHVPVVAHYHGLDLSSMLGQRWYRWSHGSQAKKMNQSIVVGSHQADVLASNGVDRKHVHLVPCGVPTDQFEPETRPVRESIQFIQVSRMVRWKGVEQGIRAFATVHQSMPATRLQFVGDGPIIEEMKELACELGLEKAVTFTGPLPPAQVVEQLQKADVFIHHSLTDRTGWCEGFGVSIAEAAAMALPLVVTRSGGIPDQVVDGVTGYLVEERDVPAMAQAMLKLAESAELRSEMGQAGRKRMIQHFDTAGQIAKLEKVLARATQ